MPQPPFHVVYCAKGARYHDEVSVAVHRARGVLDGRYRFVLISDVPTDTPGFDEIIVMPEEDPFLFKVRAITRCPLERFVFLDTDTMVLEDFSELYELLERFEIAVRPERIFSPVIFEEDAAFGAGVPIAFPEFNTGVLGVRRSPAVERFFDAWWTRSHHDIALSGRRPFTNEQLGFRWALYHSDVRYASLEAPYNLNYCMSQEIFGTVKIAHGRERPDLMEALCANINRHDKVRVLMYTGTDTKTGTPSSITLHNIHMQRVGKYFFDKS